MAKKNFPTKTLIELCNVFEGDIIHEMHVQKITSDKYLSESRWHMRYEFVFKDLMNDKLYKTYFSKGKTEYQDYSPYDDEGPIVICEEVIPRQIVETIYVGID